MKKNMAFLMALCTAAVLTGCNQKANETTNTTAAEPADKKINITVAQLATNKDLYCGMEVQDGGIADTAVYDGKIYGFCSSECKAEVAKDPAKYITQK